MLSLTLWQQMVRWSFILGFFFLVGVGIWAIVTVTRLKREQAIALLILQSLAARAGLKETIDKIQVTGPGLDRPPR